MPTLQCFLTESEVVAMLIDFCASRQSKMIVITRTKVAECRSAAEVSDTISKNARHLLVIGTELEVSDTLRLFSPRAEGWLEVTVGTETEHSGKNILTMSSFAAKHIGVGGKFHRWFRTYANYANFKKGVNARNEINGGGRFVPDIYYSDRALGVESRRVEWRQFIDGNVVFAPYTDSKVV